MALLAVVAPSRVRMLSFVGSACILLAAYPSLSAAEPKVTQRVFMDLTIDGEAAGRMVIGMFGNAVPKTVGNFVGLATGNTTRRNGAPLTFQGTKFHRIIPGFMAQGGDAGDSIFGGTFEDESFRLRHTKVGRLSMANYGPATNKAQFFITFKATPHLNGKHVVFGQVEEASLPLLMQLEKVGTRGGKPTKTVVVAGCGVLGLD